MTTRRENFPELDDARMPHLLDDAHLWLSVYEVPLTASLEQQRHHHALAAEVYRRVEGTEPDPRKQVWARHWGQAEQAQAKHLAARITVRDALVSYLGPDFDNRCPDRRAGSAGAGGAR